MYFLYFKIYVILSTPVLYSQFILPKYNFLKKYIKEDTIRYFNNASFFNASQKRNC